MFYFKSFRTFVVRKFIPVFGLIFLSACGGSSSNEPESPSNPPTQTTTGVFLDNAVEGLAFSSGAQSGLTDSAGTFTYEVNATVTFTLGDIEIGSASGKATLTPLDLVSDAVDETNPHVINILRFLQTLDDDGDVENGILITENTRELAADKSVNFDQSVIDFENDGNVQTIISDITSASSAGARSLINTDDTLFHFRTTLAEINGTTPPVRVYTIALSGDDTVDIGTQLKTGQIDYGRVDLTGLEESIVIVDEGSTIDENEPVPHDITNTFVMVVAKDMISMTIVREGTSYRYACASSVFTPCGDLVFDIDNRTATFNDATVINTSTDAILTLNGEVKWDEN
ncbi:hypothetical protein [Aliikangiella sp. IMCC44359]|uniref:hypothetical protein n=1 Tax=Aliikangiella sp. IMCC44359 TaxID=3459125 RepID=UPI00403B128E